MNNELSRDYWMSHYNDSDGPLKVSLRRNLNSCLAPGQTVLDVDQFAIDAIRKAGIDDSRPIYDVGCGGEYRLLRLLAVSGHKGSLKGFEPNTAQISGATWEPGEPDPELESLLLSGDSTRVDTFFERFRTYDPPRHARMGAITLIETVANYLPVPTKSSGATASMFAAYAIPKEKQPAAFREMARTVDDDGINPVFLSHDGNKAGIRREEFLIGKVLEEITGEPVQTPRPINAGLTTEAGVELMADIWPYLYLYEHEGTIYINTAVRAKAYEAAHYTTSDLYIVGQGNDSRPVTIGEYSEAFEEVVGREFKLAGINEAGTGGAITDDLKQGLIIGSRRELELPEFQTIKNGR